MGIVAAAKARGVPMTVVQVHAYGRRLGRWSFDPGRIDSPHPHPIILGQDRTERVLEEHLEGLGVRVEWGTEAVAYIQDDDGVTVRLRNADGTEREARAAYLVGCEPAERDTQGLRARLPGDAYTGEQFIQADCKIRWELPRGSSYLFLTEVGYLMVIEMPDDLVRIFISLPDLDPSVDDPPSLEDIRVNLVRLTGHEAELSDAVWLARYRTAHRRAPSFRKGRAFLAGDAGAHPRADRRPGDEHRACKMPSTSAGSWPLSSRVRPVPSCSTATTPNACRWPSNS